MFSETESKNHLNENVRRMRQIQREAKKREAGGVKPVKALWKSSMFESVPSKVSEELNVSESSQSTLAVVSSSLWIVMDQSYYVIYIV